MVEKSMCPEFQFDWSIDMEYISPESVVHMGSAVVSSSDPGFTTNPHGGIQLPFIPG